jgi:hypothetical protein
MWVVWEAPTLRSRRLIVREFGISVLATEDNCSWQMKGNRNVHSQVGDKHRTFFTLTRFRHTFSTLTLEPFHDYGWLFYPLTFIPFHDNKRSHPSGRSHVENFNANSSGGTLYKDG